MTPHSVIDVVISGGQTGVDRAALDIALALGLPIDGWCPKGRLAEDGRLPTRYRLRETPSWQYAQRTRWNVRDSDGTLILTHGMPAGGTALTLATARRLHKPLYVVDLAQIAEAVDVAPIRTWLKDSQIRRLNVAGPRESSASGVYQAAYRLLEALLSTT